MSLTRTIRTLVLTLALALPSGAFAHEPAKGVNGGLRVDAGKYHTELVVDGTTKVTLFLSDAEDKPVPAAGFKAQAIFIIDGKSQRFPLELVDGARLVGTAPAPVSAGVKGVVQLTTPDGATVQGKF